MNRRLSEQKNSLAELNKIEWNKVPPTLSKMRCLYLTDWPLNIQTETLVVMIACAVQIKFATT